MNRGALTYKTRNRPIDRPNYTSQNRPMNEHHGRRPAEAGIGDAAHTAEVRLEVESTAGPRFGPDREYKRTMTATQTVDGRTRTVASEKVEYGNFPVAGPRPPRPETPDPAQVDAWKARLREKAAAPRQTPTVKPPKP